MLIWQDNLNTLKVIEEVIGFGLFSFSDEPRFSWRGCEHCAHGLGASVYDLRGYRSFADTELYEFQVCGDCMNSLNYGKEEQLRCGRK